MALPDHKKQFMMQVGFQADEIAAVEEVMAQKALSAQSEGLRSKEAPQPVAVTTTVVTQPTPQPQPQQQPVDVEAQLKEAQTFLLKALEPILAPLTAEVSSLRNELTQLKQQGESLTPAASALAAKSIQNQEGAHLLAGRQPDKTPKENNSDKEGPTAASVLGGQTLGVPFLDNILALNVMAKQKGGNQ